MADKGDTEIPNAVKSAYPAVTQDDWEKMSAEQRGGLLSTAHGGKWPTGVPQPMIKPTAESLEKSLGQSTTGPDPDAAIQEGVEGLEKLLGKKPAAKKKPVKAAKKVTAPTQTDIENQIKAANLWNQLGQTLVSNQQALDVPVEESISGALTAPASAHAANQALSDLGLGPNDKASSWLNSELSQAKTNDAPLTAAMNTYTKEYEQGQAGVSNALGQMGQANALAVQTAPEADWVNAIVQHVLSNVNYYGEITPSLAATLPTAVQQSLAQSGGGGELPAGSFSITDTPSQWAQQIQNYYDHASTASSLSSPAKAAAGSQGGGTGGVIPSDTGSAPS